MAVEMKGATVFLIGSGKAAAEKLEKLLLFEANILLFAENGFENASHPQLSILRRKLTEADLEQRPLFVVAAADAEENRRISALCQEQHIPVNAVDMPELCSFTFPAIIKRGGVTISIASGGKSPALASLLRGKIEDSLPEDLDAVLEELAELRLRLKEQEPDPEKRKNILKQAAEQLLSK